MAPPAVAPSVARAVPQGSERQRREYDQSRCHGTPATPPGPAPPVKHRLLARDYETLTASSSAMIHVAPIDNLAKRTTDETIPARPGTHQDMKGKST
jgi:hypothetical protein